MAFQPIAFQLNFQQLLEEEERPIQVVLIPQYIRFRTKLDVALYVLAVYAKDQAVRAPITQLFKRERVRSQGYVDLFKTENLFKEFSFI